MFSPLHRPVRGRRHPEVYHGRGRRRNPVEDHAAMLIVLSEASEQLEPSASARDIRASTEAARLVGCRVFTIPPDFERCETAKNALFGIGLFCVGDNSMLACT